MRVKIEASDELAFTVDSELIVDGGMSLCV
jgi:hypothetical protein